MSYSHLEGWTPIGYRTKPEPGLLWLDLRRCQLDRPLSNRALAVWRAQEQPPIIRTDLSALAVLDYQPALEPGLIIVHPSRCGSTLLARLAAAGGDAQLLLEPALLFQLLQHNLAGGFNGPVEPVLREAVRALSRVRIPGERHCVLKLNSQMTRFLPEIRRAFPNTPIVWLQRQPAEVVESNLSNPPRRGRPASVDEMSNWVLRRVTLAYIAAKAFVDDQVQVLDYRDLPNRAWTTIADIMGFDPEVNLARLHDIARRDSKTGTPYLPRPRQALSEQIQAIIRDTLDPLYDALARRGLS